MRKMYDSVTASDIPTNCDLVAGYIDGYYRWSDADWARFPNQVKVHIATNPATNDGIVIDTEQGDATPQTAVSWVQMRRRAGKDPTVYCSRSEWQAVIDAFNAARVPQPHYWIADYDNQQQLYAGAVAKQYADAAMVGGHYDASIVADHWPGVDTDQPIPRGPNMSQGQMHPTQVGRLDIVFARPDQSVGHMWSSDGGATWPNVESVGGPGTKATDAWCVWSSDGQFLNVIAAGVGPEPGELYLCRLPIAPAPGSPKPDFALLPAHQQGT